MSTALHTQEASARVVGSLFSSYSRIWRHEIKLVCILPDLYLLLQDCFSVSILLPNISRFILTQKLP